MDKNYYEILEVSPNASPDVIESVYKTLAKRYHPDLQKEWERVAAETKMKELNVAYDTLKNPLKRRQYDAYLIHSKALSEQQTSPPKALITCYINTIKAKLSCTKGITINYRYLILTPLLLLFGIVVWVISLNSFNKEKYDFEQAQLELIGVGSPKSEEIVPLKVDTPEIHSSEKVLNVPEGRFTLGSSQSDVKKVMGEPTSKFLYSWNYGESLIYFDKDGKVDGWAKIDKKLKAWLGDRIKNAHSFSIGSTKDEVLAAMGTPTSVYGKSWGYSKSIISFDDTDRVKDWIEVDKHLKAEPVKKSKVIKN